MIQFCFKSFVNHLEWLQNVVGVQLLAEIEAGRGATELSDGHKDSVTDLLLALLDDCKKLEFASSESRIIQLRQCLLGFFPPCTYEAVNRDLRMLGNEIVSELGARQFAYIAIGISDYFEKEKLFGEEAFEALPEAREDIKESGNCLAAELYTAAVFQLMRVAEIALRIIAKEVGIETEHAIEYETWHTVIKAIKDRVEKLTTPRGPQRDKELEFYHSMILRLDACKDTWRNIVSHTRESYTKHKALDAKDHVEDMVQKLAKWLLEKNSTGSSTTIV
jgi:hypothetical protein